MSPNTMNPYSRLASPPARSAPAEAKATKAQVALEIALFFVFGSTILIAAVGLMASSSSAYLNVPNRVAEGLKGDRVNVLLATTSRTGNTLTTNGMLLLSIKPSTHAVAVTAIPRDLWVPLGKYGTRPLSTALAVGKSSGYPGAGPGLTSDTVEKITGQPVHAFVTLDESDLVKAIDTVGGIDVKVHRGVYDYRSGDRFTPGPHHLDGRHASRFAQSPYVVGPSATRSAHEVRQQEVMLALLARATKPGVKTPFASLDPDSGTNLTPDQVSMVSSFIAGQQPRRVSLARCVALFQATSFVYTGEAVRPRSGNFDEIRLVVANVFI